MRGMRAAVLNPPSNTWPCPEIPVSPHTKYNLPTVKGRRMGIQFFDTEPVKTADAIQRLLLSSHPNATGRLK